MLGNKIFLVWVAYQCHFDWLKDTTFCVTSMATSLGFVFLFMLFLFLLSSSVPFNYGGMLASLSLFLLIAVSILVFIVFIFLFLSFGGNSWIASFGVPYFSFSSFNWFSPILDSLWHSRILELLFVLYIKL